MESENSESDESRRIGKVVDPPQDAEKLGVSGNSKSDESRHKRRFVDPPQNLEKLGVSVRELLECPVCLNIMYPPIYQCCNGHPLCSNCRPKILDNHCPTCRQELGNIRCLTLEKVAESLELPCKYQKFGCSDVFPYLSNLKHESQCSFRPYSCPLSGRNCSAFGDIPFLVSHLRDCDNALIARVSTVDQIFKRFVDSDPQGATVATWSPVVYSFSGRYFYMHMEKFQLGVVWLNIAFLQLMGDKEEAETYRYNLEFDGNERKVIFQGVPRSIRESIFQVRDSLGCLILQNNLFFDDDKKLNFKVIIKIWKALT